MTSALAPNDHSKASGASAGDRPTRTRHGKVQSLQERLAKLEREAETIRQKLLEQRRREREATARQIAVFVNKEDLADFSIDAWRGALPQIRHALQLAQASAAPAS